jgi:hypothetical protein
MLEFDIACTLFCTRYITLADTQKSIERESELFGRCNLRVYQLEKLHQIQAIEKANRIKF